MNDVFLIRIVGLLRVVTVPLGSIKGFTLGVFGRSLSGMSFSLVLEDFDLDDDEEGLGDGFILDDGAEDLDEDREMDEEAEGLTVALTTGLISYSSSDEYEASF
jgi:hypothetical protein